MSAEGEVSKPRPVLTRKIGVGLTRSNLVSRSEDRGLRNPREGLLTSPSRVVISSSSLAPRRTPSDRYQNYAGYTNSRLGEIRKNTSAPNVTDLADGNSEVDGNFQTDVEVNKNLNVARQGFTLPVIGRPSTLSKDSSIFENIQENDRQFNSQDVSESKSVKNVTWNNVTSKPSWDYNARSKVKNYDIDLEEDEEDACATETKSDQTKLKATEIQHTRRPPFVAVSVRKTSSPTPGIEPVKIDVTSHYPSAQHSPSKDSGYGSPRIDLASDLYTASSTGSRSDAEVKVKPKQPIKSPTETNKLADTINSSVETKSDPMAAPARPARTKSIARKLSANLGKGRDLSLQQQGSNCSKSIGSFDNATYDVIGSVRPGNSDSKGLSDQLSPSNFNRNFVRAATRGQYPNEKAPGLIRRSSRKLTRRNINFKRLVSTCLYYVD